MSSKRLIGKDGELILVHKGIIFARAERFTATLNERVALNHGIGFGRYSVGTGYHVALRLDDITITDEDIALTILKELERGIMPDLGFQGKFKRKDGFAEKIVFQNCALTGELDHAGFIKGAIWDMHLCVNSLSDEQVEQFHAHGY